MFLYIFTFEIGYYLRQPMVYVFLLITALIVMEKAYDKSRMKRFLKFKMDCYLSSRGSESLKEVPLEQMENQGYIHYQKDSVVMYYLKELIGEEAVNKAL